MGRSGFALHLRVGFFGLLLGFSLGRMGFADWNEVHRMFTFADLRLFSTFAGAVVLVGLGFVLFARQGELPAKRIHKGSILGGALFGAGWALTGACPAVALVQLGHGRVMAVATIVGISAGTLLYQRVAAPRLLWDVGACS